MIVLGIGEIGVSRTQGELIKTYALGSCVALCVSAPKINAAGMVHIALPNSQINSTLKTRNPGHFADTGIPELFRLLANLGVMKPYKGLRIKLVGGANDLKTNDTFMIGKRNVLEIKKQLWKLGLIPDAEEVGGNISRTVSLEPGAQFVTISSPGRVNWTI
jgi:chemotaxis protein CheD